VNKRELVGEVASRTGVAPGVVAQVVDAVISTVTRSVVSGDTVVLSGFGTFVRKARARRVGRDIRAGRPLTVPATHLPAFRPGLPFREAVAHPSRRRDASKTPGATPRRKPTATKK